MKISVVTIADPQITNQLDTESTVVIPLVSYYLQDGTTRNFNNLTFLLSRSASGQNWQINGMLSN